MLRTTRASSASSSSSTVKCSRRSRCLGFVSPRTSTLLLALLGVVAHLQTYRHLEVLYDSFPQVPSKPRMPLSASATATTASHTTPSTGRAGQIARPHDYDRWSDANDDSVVADAVAAAVGASDDVSLPKPSATDDRLHMGVADTVSDEERLALIKPPRWFNLLPKRPWGSEATLQQEERPPTAGEVALWRAQQAGQDKERKSWEAARRLTIVMRVYALVSAAACVSGMYGVLKSNLAATRIFVLSSFLDVFLFAFSLVSMCIIVTYPEIRAMLCEQISSGELHAMLNYVRGANNDDAPPAASPSAAALLSSSTKTDATTAMAAIMQTTTSSSSSPAGQSATSFLSYAASSFWKRAMASTQLSSVGGGDDGDDGSPAAHLYWWDTLIDNMLENESCDDIFLSVLVPLGLVMCLVYLAFRIHFLFVIRTYYTSLLRDRMSFYFGGNASSKCADATGVTGKQQSRVPLAGPLDEKARKYSSSSSSSSTTAFETSNNVRVKSPLSWLAINEKTISEKMA